MKRLYIPLILFILLISEGVALEILPPMIMLSKTMIIPHWVLICLIFAAIFYDADDTYYSVLYGLIFGLLIDIVYTGMLGVYMFSYSIATYIIHGLKKMFQPNIYVTVILGVAGIACAEIMIKVIFQVIGMTDMGWEMYFLYRLVPTILANSIFLLLLFSFLPKRFERWGNEHFRNTGSVI